MPSAHAQTVITNTLNGTFYYDASQSITSIALAQGFIAKNAPTGVFTATQSLLDNPGYNGNDNSTVKGFLGTDGNSYVGNNTNLQDGIFDLKAFVNVPAANSYTFRLGSDDGSALFVDGKEVINNDGVHAYANLFGSDALTAGQHSVEVLYFNHSYQGVKARLTSKRPLAG